MYICDDKHTHKFLVNSNQSMRKAEFVSRELIFACVTETCILEK
jgi:hypothetical protein